MLDIKFIRENKEKVIAAAKNKNVVIDFDHVLEVDDKRKELQIVVQKLQEEKNILNDSIKGKPTDEQIEKGRQLREELSREEDALKAVQEEVKLLLYKVPNVPLESVPVGKSEDENVVIKTVGEKPNFSFTVKNHAQLGEKLDLIDKERAAKVAGPRFAYLKGDLVLLHFALVQFGLSQLTKREFIQNVILQNKLDLDDKPFIPVLPPAMIKTSIYEETCRLNGEEVTYKLSDDELWLNASAEHSLCSMYEGETLDEKLFPLRFVGYTTAFRREAGTYGKDMEGILRLHQFDKLEMESFAKPEKGYQEHLLQVGIQEALMQALELPYQVIQKCTADIGNPNAAGVDINVWLPGQDKYRETHTADYMTDYQARRLKTRVKLGTGETEFVHTADATVFSQRPLIAILENYQQEDGTVRVPKVLQPIVGKEVIGK